MVTLRPLPSNSWPTIVHTCIIDVTIAVIKSDFLYDLADVVCHVHRKENIAEGKAVGC